MLLSATVHQTTAHLCKLLTAPCHQTRMHTCAALNHDSEQLDFQLVELEQTYLSVQCTASCLPQYVV